MKNELKQSDKLEVMSTSMYTTTPLLSLIQPSTATMPTLTPALRGPTTPLFWMLIISLQPHSQVFEEEEYYNNEGVREHYDSQLAIIGTSAYETWDNGLLTWGSFEAKNKNKTITNKITQQQRNINAPT